MKNNIIKYIFFILIAVLLIFAVYKVNINNENSKNNTNKSGENDEQTITTEIKLAIAGLDNINPILSNNQNVQDVVKVIYEPLINLTQDYKAEPCLATEWAKTGENNYIIKLRENVKWSNGENFTADDVLYTIDRLKEISSIYSYNVQYVVGVDIVDDYTIKITLDRNIPFFEYNLTFPIMSKSYYDGEDFANSAKNVSPVGTGMFKISEVQDSNIVLKRNDSWWNINNRKPVLETITINTNSSMAEVYNAFKMGNVDFIGTRNLNYTDYIGTIGYSTKEYTGREHGFIAINTQNTILSNLEVRQAISYAIDRDNIVASVFGGKYYTADFPLSYGSWLNSEQDVGADYNLEMANKVLQDAGWTFRGKNWQKSVDYRTQKLVVNLLVKQSDSNRVAVANTLQAQLAQVGIVVNIRNVSDSQYSLDLANKNYDMLLGTTTVSASPNLSTYFGENNLANYSNAEVVAIMQEINNTVDENVLKEKYARLKEIYKTDVPYISLYMSKNVVAYNTSLAGEVAPNWFNLFYNIESWYK